MTALVLQTPLSEGEAGLMVEALAGDGFGRNRLFIVRRTAVYRLAQSLEARGLVSSKADFGGVTIAVTTAGARALVKVGAVSVADLAIDADRILSGLTAYRRAMASGLCDLSICDGWDAFREDDPFQRVAAAVLLKHGQVEQRGPTEQEHADQAARFFLRAKTNPQLEGEAG